MTVKVTTPGCDLVWMVSGEYRGATDAVTHGSLICDATAAQMMIHSVLLYDETGERLLCDAMEAGLWRSLSDSATQSIFFGAMEAMADRFSEESARKLAEYEAREGEYEDW